jgi:hypothetical protein
MNQSLIAVLALVVTVTSIWVVFDSSRMGVKSGCLGGGLADMGPFGWFMSTFLLWGIAFPLYLATRPKYVKLQSGTEFPSTATRTSPPPHSNAPSEGWYDDPEAPGNLRWWGGTAWGPRAPEQ